ncbi:MAG: hypothetical protein ACE5EB_03080 [Thermodesulfobacteriota bacterium]
MDSKGLEMTGGNVTTPGRRKWKGAFVTRQLQLSLSILVVMALLAGLILQTASTAVIERYSLGTPVLGLILVIGYIIIVLFISVFFANKFVGPFKRIEYEMKLISSGELSRRISLRDGDDLHVRHFVSKVNDFIGNFEDISKRYNELNSVIDGKLDEINMEISKEDLDCEKVMKDIMALREEVHKMREVW